MEGEEEDIPKGLGEKETAGEEEEEKPTPLVGSDLDIVAENILSEHYDIWEISDISQPDPKMESDPSLGLLGGDEIRAAVFWRALHQGDHLLEAEDGDFLSSVEIEAREDLPSADVWKQEYRWHNTLAFIDRTWTHDRHFFPEAKDEAALEEWKKYVSPVSIRLIVSNRAEKRTYIDRQFDTHDFDPESDGILKLQDPFVVPGRIPLGEKLENIKNISAVRYEFDEKDVPITMVKVEVFFGRGGQGEGDRFLPGPGIELEPSDNLMFDRQSLENLMVTPSDRPLSIKGIHLDPISGLSLQYGIAYYRDRKVFALDIVELWLSVPLEEYDYPKENPFKKRFDVIVQRKYRKEVGEWDPDMGNIRIEKTPTGGHIIDPHIRKLQIERRLLAYRAGIFEIKEEREKRKITTRRRRRKLKKPKEEKEKEGDISYDVEDAPDFIRNHPERDKLTRLIIAVLPDLDTGILNQLFFDQSYRTIKAVCGIRELAHYCREMMTADFWRALWISDTRFLERDADDDPTMWQQSILTLVDLLARFHYDERMAREGKVRREFSTDVSTSTRRHLWSRYEAILFDPHILDLILKTAARNENDRLYLLSDPTDDLWSEGIRPGIPPSLIPEERAFGNLLVGEGEDEDWYFDRGQLVMANTYFFQPLSSVMTEMDPLWKMVSQFPETKESMETLKTEWFDRIRRGRDRAGPSGADRFLPGKHDDLAYAVGDVPKKPEGNVAPEGSTGWIQGYPTEEEVKTFVRKNLADFRILVMAHPEGATLSHEDIGEEEYLKKILYDSGASGSIPVLSTVSGTNLYLTAEGVRKGPVYKKMSDEKLAVLAEYALIFDGTIRIVLELFLGYEKMKREGGKIEEEEKDGGGDYRFHSGQFLVKKLLMSTRDVQKYLYTLQYEEDHAVDGSNRFRKWLKLIIGTIQEAEEDLPHLIEESSPDPPPDPTHQTMEASSRFKAGVHEKRQKGDNGTISTTLTEEQIVNSLMAVPSVLDLSRACRADKTISTVCETSRFWGSLHLGDHFLSLSYEKLTSRAREIPLRELGEIKRDYRWKNTIDFSRRDWGSEEWSKDKAENFFLPEWEEGDDGPMDEWTEYEYGPWKEEDSKYFSPVKIAIDLISVDDTGTKKKLRAIFRQFYEIRSGDLEHFVRGPSEPGFPSSYGIRLSAPTVDPSLFRALPRGMELKDVKRVEKVGIDITGHVQVSEGTSRTLFVDYQMRFGEGFPMFKPLNLATNPGDSLDPLLDETDFQNIRETLEGEGDPGRANAIPYHKVLKLDGKEVFMLWYYVHQTGDDAEGYEYFFDISAMDLLVPLEEIKRFKDGFGELVQKKYHMDVRDRNPDLFPLDGPFPDRATIAEEQFQRRLASYWPGGVPATARAKFPPSSSSSDDGNPSKEGSLDLDMILREYADRKGKGGGTQTFSPASALASTNGPRSLERKTILGTGTVRFSVMVKEGSSRYLNMVPGKESDPEITLFLTGSRTTEDRTWILKDLYRQTVGEAGTGTSASTKKGNGNPTSTLELQVTRSMLESEDCFLGIRLSCTIDIFDERGTYSGYRRKEHMADSVIRLRDAVYGEKDFTVSLIDYSTDESEERSVLLVTRERFSPSFRIGPSPDLDFETYGRTMNSILERFMENYRGGDPLLPRVTSARPMHIPVFRTNTVPLPAAAFSQYNVHPSEMGTPQMVEVVGHRLRISLEMNDWDESELIRVLSRRFSTGSGVEVATFRMALKIVAQSVTLTANSMDYISDHSGKREVERFKIIRLLFNAGDCEDSTKEIRLCIEELMSVRSSNLEKDNLLVYWSRMVMQLYIPMMNTGMATSPSMTPTEEAASGDHDMDYICHIYLTLVPRWFFVEKLEWTNTKRKAVLVASMERDLNKMAWERREVPVLVLEGTNWSDPLQGPLPTYVPAGSTRDLALSERLEAERMRMQIERKHGALMTLGYQMKQPNFSAANIYDIPEFEFSGFYRWVVDGWVDLKRFGIFEIVDVSVGYGPRSSHEYGVEFRDWVSRSETIRFVPTYELTRMEQDVIDKVLSLEFPVPTYEAPSIGTRKVPSLESIISLSNPPFVPPLTNRNSFQTPYLSYLINREEKITKEIIDSLRTVVIEEGTFYLDYRFYEFSEDLYTIEIRLWPRIE